MVKIIKSNMFKAVTGICVFMTVLLAGIYFTVSKEDVLDESTRHTDATDISNWVIYDNEEYGYRFKYPENLEVIPGTDPQYELYDSPEAVFIAFYEKYPNIKSLHPSDPESFLRYEINITRSMSDKQQQAERDDVRVYRDEQGNVFTFVLEGMNPKHAYVSDLLEKIENQQLTDWVNGYPEYLKILDGVYGSFEVYTKQK